MTPLHPAHSHNQGPLAHHEVDESFVEDLRSVINDTPPS